MYPDRCVFSNFVVLVILLTVHAGTSTSPQRYWLPVLILCGQIVLLYTNTFLLFSNNTIRKLFCLTHINKLILLLVLCVREIGSTVHGDVSE